MKAVEMNHHKNDQARRLLLRSRNPRLLAGAARATRSPRFSTTSPDVGTSLKSDSDVREIPALGRFEQPLHIQPWQWCRLTEPRCAKSGPTYHNSILDLQFRRIRDNCLSHLGLLCASRAELKSTCKGTWSICSQYEWIISDPLFGGTSFEEHEWCRNLEWLCVLCAIMTGKLSQPCQTIVFN